MAKLNIDDIERIAKEVEEQEVLFLKRKLEKLEQDAYWEAYMDSKHGDWGDRDCE